MAISFSHAWILVIMPIVSIGVFFIWRNGPRLSISSLIIRFVMFITLIIALASPSITRQIDRQTIVFVADYSDSTRVHHSTIEGFIQESIEAMDPSDSIGVVVVGLEAMIDAAIGQNYNNYEIRAAPNSTYTNLAAGVRLATSVFHQDDNKRIVLISDGIENLGDVVNEVKRMLGKDIVIDVVPLDIFTTPEVFADKLKAPTSVDTGEILPVNVTIGSTYHGEAAVKIVHNGVIVQEGNVVIKPGSTDVTFKIPSGKMGINTISAEVYSDNDTISENNKLEAIVIVTGMPSVLVVEGLPDSGADVINALTATGFKVRTVSPDQFPTSLQTLLGYDTTVLVDVNIDSLSLDIMERIKIAVGDLGHGLVVIGGEQSFTIGGYHESPLEDVIPVFADVPLREDRSPSALLLVIDKSASMGYRDPIGSQIKIDMTKVAATGVLDEFKTGDFLGILAFDTNSFWVADLKEIGDPDEREVIKVAISKLKADGGTNLYKAMDQAYTALSNLPVQKKHIIVLTDGNSLEGDFDSLISRIDEAEITVSTIGVGKGANRDLMMMLSEEADGRFYLIDDSVEIPRIVINETLVGVQDAVIEKTFQPNIVMSDPIVGNFDSYLPRLDGYIVTRPKNGGRVIVTSDRGDPILAKWQYGLGRVVSWMSDSQGRWTTALNTSREGARFWARLVDWTLVPENLSLQMQVEHSDGTGIVMVDGVVQANSQLFAKIIGPELDGLTVPLNITSTTRYEARFQAYKQGVYFVEVFEDTTTAENPVLRGSMIVSYPQEYRYSPSNIMLLNELVLMSGGAILKEPADIFDNNQTSTYVHVEVGWWLILLATLLLPIDIALRRLRSGF